MFMCRVRTVLFCILFTSAVSVLFLSSVAQAGWFSQEEDRVTAEISVTLETFPPDVESSEDILFCGMMFSDTFLTRLSFIKSLVVRKEIHKFAFSI